MQAAAETTNAAIMNSLKFVLSPIAIRTPAADGKEVQQRSIYSGIFSSLSSLQDGFSIPFIVIICNLYYKSISP
jgi:hypothetical protein